MSAAEISPMITVYAWVVALTSLPAMLLLAQVERPRWLWLYLLTVIVVTA
jgi:DHA1 family L-arabinose/isopropyl-beta-D-thiogalactopyranoside export protein-like MFS transporter